MKNFKEKLALVPTKPGSYQMKNKDGVIIYVGKAKNLQRRLRSYFTRTVTGKTRLLVEDIDDFDYIVTSSELESLILEITLIKKYDPKYNILLRDDKTYPYIELTNEKYPVVKIVRNTKIKNYLYGPFPNATAARKTVNIINRLYPLRKCERLEKELCLYYHIHECLGFCKKDIGNNEIEVIKKEIISFLKGDSSKVVEKINIEMEKASASMNYERAIELREMLNDIDTTLKKQKIDLNNNESFDLMMSRIVPCSALPRSFRSAPCSIQGGLKILIPGSVPCSALSQRSCHSDSRAVIQNNSLLILSISAFTLS